MTHRVDMYSLEDWEEFPGPRVPLRLPPSPGGGVGLVEVKPPVSELRLEGGREYMNTEVEF